MKLTSKLKGFGIFATILVIILGITTYWRALQVDLAVQRSEIAGQIVKEAFMLTVLNNDFLQTRSERSQTQWKSQYARLTKTIDSYHIDNNQEQQIIDEIREGKRGLLIHFSHLQKLENIPASSSASALLEEAEKRIGGQLAIDMQNIVTLASRLAESNSARLAGIRQTTYAILLTVIVFLGGSLVITYFIFARSISVPIQKLIEGTKSLASGNLYIQLPITTHDEFGQLATSFNEMVLRLQSSYYKIESEKAEDSAILASIGDGVIAWDKEGKVKLANTAAATMLGYQVNDLIGKKGTEILIIEDEKGFLVPPFQRPIEMAISSGERVTTTITKAYWYVRSDRTKFPVAITATPIIIKNQIVGAIEIFRDITTEKTLDEVKTTFINIAAHELRTPMTAVKGLTSMVLHGDYGVISEKLKKQLTTVSASTEKIIQLLNNMLDISQLETGEMKIVLTEVLIGTIITNTIQKIEPLAKQKGILIEASAIYSASVQVDIEKAEQVCKLLLENAVKFTNRGRIVISSKKEQDFLIVFISDTGIGMSLQEQQLLFHKFQQVFSHENGKPSGSGLGLYLASELASKMGGKVWLVKSEVGKGSIFAFSFPLAKSSTAESVRRVQQKDHSKEWDMIYFTDDKD